MISKRFPVNHPKAGLRTFFREKIIASLYDINVYSYKKLHTIRANYPLWEKRIKEVREGKAILSLRQWVDKPYRSKTQEIARLSASDGVGIQMLEFEKDCDGMASWYFFNIDGKYPSLVDVALNDGLTVEAWREWFKDYDLSRPLAVIHFTPFRY